MAKWQVFQARLPPAVLPSCPAVCLLPAAPQPGGSCYGDGCVGAQMLSTRQHRVPPVSPRSEEGYMAVCHLAAVPTAAAGPSWWQDVPQPLDILGPASHQLPWALLSLSTPSLSGVCRG